MAASLKKEEEESFFEEDRDQPIPPESVVAYNELRSCADLKRMHATGKLEIQPDFQREVVWKKDEQARFIDSLVKQLPIPSMCFSLDYQTQRWKVIDGLQRMSTIISFLGDPLWTIAQLPDIHPLLRGKTNVDLRSGTEDQKRLYSSVEDISIPITVIRCSYENSSHMRYLFTIFNRLNSGGVRLNNQEIRNCIYSGKFNDLLKAFDRSDVHWIKVKKRIWGKMDRFRSVEILLRAIAFSRALGAYDGNLAGFLNNEMLKSSKLSEDSLRELAGELSETAKFADSILMEMGSGKKSLTFVEGLLVGILANIKSIQEGVSDLESWSRHKAEEFLSLSSFGEGARYALSSGSLVKSRLEQSVNFFSR